MSDWGCAIGWNNRSLLSHPASINRKPTESPLVILSTRENGLDNHRIPSLGTPIYCVSSWDFSQNKIIKRWSDGGRQDCRYAPLHISLCPNSGQQPRHSKENTIIAFSLISPWHTAHLHIKCEGMKAVRAYGGFPSARHVGARYFRSHCLLGRNKGPILLRGLETSQHFSTFGLVEDWSGLNMSQTIRTSSSLKMTQCWWI